MSIQNNPLLQYARRAELSIKLPFNDWYRDDEIERSPNGEVEVFPMLPKDELLLMNPDSLMSGQANINLIKSCVPAIKHPERLLYPDANVLFLAIQKVSYGDTLTMSVKCPKCAEKAVEIGDKEKIAEAEKKGEIVLHPQDMEYSIAAILDSITYAEKEYTMEFDGLKVYFQPNTLGDKQNYSLMSFKQEKIVNTYKDYDFEESVTNDERRQIMNEATRCYFEISDIGNHLVTDAIIKIQLPDETFITDKEMIYEFISNTRSSIVNEIHQKVRELNEIGAPKKLTYQCSCCGHEWEDVFFGFNQVDFFGLGS